MANYIVWLVYNLQEFHVTKMTFNRQKRLATLKGEIPQMVTSFILEYFFAGI